MGDNVPKPPAHMLAAPMKRRPTSCIDKHEQRYEGCAGPMDSVSCRKNLGIFVWDSHELGYDMAILWDVPFQPSASYPNERLVEISLVTLNIYVSFHL